MEFDNDKAIEQEKRRLRAIDTALSLGVVFTGLLVGAGYWGFTQGWGLAAAIMTMVGAVGVLGSIALAGIFRPGEAAKALAKRQSSYRELYQSRWVGCLAFLSVGLTPLAISSGLALYSWAYAGVEMPWHAVIHGATLPVLLISLLSWGLSSRVRKLMGDELMTSLRDNAIRWACLALVLGLWAIYGVGVFNPHLAIALVPTVIVLASMLGALRLWWRVREAERG